MVDKSAPNVNTRVNVNTTLYQTGCGIESILDMEKAMVQGNLHGGDISVLTLQHTIFDLSSNPQLTQAVFYMLPIYTHGKLYLGYINVYSTHITLSKLHKYQYTSLYP